MEHFGERLRRLRGDKPQKSVAEALDIPQTTLSSLEKQESIPRGDILKKFADFFGIGIDYFYDAPEPQSSKPARAWLEHLRSDLKGSTAIATHSRVPLGEKAQNKITEVIKEKYENSSNKNERYKESHE